MGWRPHLSSPAPIRSMKRPLMTRRDDSLIGQIVAANVVLVAITLFAASLAAGLDLTVADQRWSFLILALAIILTLCVNLWMLQRRFAPLERLITRIEGIDPAEPSSHHLPGQDPVEEIDKLSRSFNGLLERIEEERRRSGTLAMRAQEEERRRLARDLHDEVNQALTAILLRLEALAQDSPAANIEEVNELKRLVNQAMEELLNLARQLRPSALDDHGLMPAVETQLKRFSTRTGVEVKLNADGDAGLAPGGRSDGGLPDPSGGARSTSAVTPAPPPSRWTSRRTTTSSSCTCATTAPASTPPPWREAASSDGPGAGLGLSGMVERARLAGGELDLRSAPGGGTTVTLRIAQLQRVAS